MRSKEKRCSIASTSIILFSYFLFSVSSVGLASAIQSNHLTINETQITTNGSDYYSPNIYGDRIVWFGFWNSRWAIYMYNLSTSRETPITINGTMPGDLVIYGDKIVWTNYFVNPNIYLYDLLTSKQTQITTSGAAASPAIYGDKIVWMDSRKDGKRINMESPGNWNIYMYNISTSKETQLFPNESMKMFPAIYEDKIVWMDSRNGGSGNYWNLSGNWDIYMYNLSTRKETQITTDETLQMHPAIYGNIIVWIDSCNGNGKIYAYNLTTSKETAISNVSWKYDHPSIYGNRIVWMDFRNGSWEIYMFDLSTSKETQVTTNSSNSQSPANPEIYGNRIVWNNWLNDANGTQLSDVYLYTVSGMETGSNTEQQSDKEKNKKVTGFELVHRFQNTSID